MTHLVRVAEISAAVVVVISGVALLVLLPVVLIFAARRYPRSRSTADVSLRGGEQKVQRYLAAAASLSEARADLDRWAGDVAGGALTEPAEVLKGTARELTAGAEALASATATDDEDKPAAG